MGEDEAGMSEFIGPAYFAFEVVPVDFDSSSLGDGGIGVGNKPARGGSAVAVAIEGDVDGRVWVGDEPAGDKIAVVVDGDVDGRSRMGDEPAGDELAIVVSGRDCAEADDGGDAEGDLHGAGVVVELIWLRAAEQCWVVLQSVLWCYGS